MKQITAAICLGMMLAVPVMHAQDSLTKKNFYVKRSQIEIVKKNCTMGLRSGNEGLISATLLMIARVKLLDTTINVAELRTVIDSLSVAHPSAGIRYEAYLTSALCGDPEWFSTGANLLNADAEQFFPLASQRLHDKFFRISSL